ncbi:MAG: M14 family zinc carboxypeptidase, partial [Bacteroidales bacterium]|nr:M14 family zinc carboxypeptidase [Bacteroidales bacterium]
MTRLKLFVLLPLMMCSGSLFSQILFSTEFESGSLGSAKIIDSVWFSPKNGDSTLYISYQIDSRFDPLNPVDTSLRPSARWYFFRMVGVKDKMVHLNIKNSEAIRPFYSYDGEDFTRFTSGENPGKGHLVKKFKNDTVYISHFIPYTWRRHKEKLDEWSQKSFVVREEIGKSSQGLPIEMITITDPQYNNVNKKKIWIHGRSHPSEQPASWHLEALTDFIISDKTEASDLRKNSIIYIVPFINPDGVYGGYSRSTSTGVNIEINWDRPDSLTMPEVKALKGALERVTSEGPLDLLMNMHSQIANSASYWIHTGESTTEKFFDDQLLLSSLTMDDRRFYREEDQQFSAVASRYAEGWIWNRFGERTLAITFETPYTYYKESPENEWVSPGNLKELAEDTFFAIYDYLMIPGESRKVVEPERLKGKGWK